jgi:hypothetical protein
VRACSTSPQAWLLTISVVIRRLENRHDCGVKHLLTVRLFTFVLLLSGYTISFNKALKEFVTTKPAKLAQLEEFQARNDGFAQAR